MLSNINVWQSLAGLGLFLFGMGLLESSLKHLAGRKVKQFLRAYIEKPVQGILAGAISTAILQSSSVLSLVTLALVSAEIISLTAAISIVFGANLGTTVTGWLVASAGLNLDIQDLALPIIAFSGFGLVWIKQKSDLKEFLSLALGFGFLLLGLYYMKHGVMAFAQIIDLSVLTNLPLIIFLITGFFITSIIQSSSATIALTLSALFAGVINIESALSITIGADLGTCITAILGSIGGLADKKRVALALIIFNVITDLLAFILLLPFLFFIKNILGITSELYVLTTFHTMFNVMGLIIFLPFIKQISFHLEKLFIPKIKKQFYYIDDIDLSLPIAAIEKLAKDTRTLIEQSLVLNQLFFSLVPKKNMFFDDYAKKIKINIDPSLSLEKYYLEIKKREGKILACALKLQAQLLDTDMLEQINQIMQTIRNSVHACKCIFDISADLVNFKESDKDKINSYYNIFQEKIDSFYSQVANIDLQCSDNTYIEKLAQLKEISQKGYNKLHRQILADTYNKSISELEASTLLNVNREMLISDQSIILAIADVLLKPPRAKDMRSFMQLDY